MQHARDVEHGVVIAADVHRGEHGHLDAKEAPVAALGAHRRRHGEAVARRPQSGEREHGVDERSPHGEGTFTGSSLELCRVRQHVFYAQLSHLNSVKYENRVEQGELSLPTPQDFPRVETLLFLLNSPPPLVMEAELSKVKAPNWDEIEILVCKKAAYEVSTSNGIVKKGSLAQQTADCYRRQARPLCAPGGLKPW